jgi:hypothetical protein
MPAKPAPRVLSAPILLALLFLAAVANRAAAAPMPSSGFFQGPVYQVDTVYNFVDVIMPDGTKRFYAGPGTTVHVNGNRAGLIDIAMGEKVRGTYRTDAKARHIVVTLDDLGAN